MDYEPAVALLREHRPDTGIVYLFGSRARGDACATSDIDVALLCDTPVPPLERFDLQESIAAALHTSVDLVDLRAASTVLRAQVLEHGIILYERDANQRALFEMTTLSDYARLNEARRQILDDIHRTGRVHG